MMLFNPKWNTWSEAGLDDWRQTLLKAADLIEQRGLAKHIREDARGQLCVHGAAMAVAETGNASGNESCAAVHGLFRYLASQGETRVHAAGCAHWNNVPARTQHEVVEALRAAAYFDHETP